MGRTIDNRATARIPIEVPVWWDGGSGITRNISPSGIYFVTDQEHETGRRINFSMEFMYAIPGHPLHLDCKAQVLRVEPQGEQLGIAAQIDEFTSLPTKGERKAKRSITFNI